MNDLISKSELIKALAERAVMHYEDWKAFKDYMGDRKVIHSSKLDECKMISDIIAATPSVEAVQVVHCKDCGHWGIGAVGETEHVKCCEYGKYMVGENGYCVYGEKKV